MIEFAHKEFQIVSGPAPEVLFRSFGNGTQISFVLKSRTEGEEGKERIVIAIIDGLSISSKRVSRDGKILRQFEGSHLIQGIALFEEEWRFFDGSYNADASDSSGNGEIQVGSAVEITKLEPNPISSQG